MVDRQTSGANIARPWHGAQEALARSDYPSVTYAQYSLIIIMVLPPSPVICVPLCYVSRYMFHVQCLMRSTATYPYLMRLQLLTCSLNTVIPTMVSTNSTNTG